LNIQVLESSVATYLGRGGQFYSTFFYSSSQNGIVKSVYDRQNHHKKLRGCFSDSRCMMVIMTTWNFCVKQ